MTEQRLEAINFDVSEKVPQNYLVTIATFLEYRKTNASLNIATMKVFDDRSSTF